MAMMTQPIVSKTRVCIKNLPPRTTEQDLKEFLLKEQQQRRKNRKSKDDSDGDEDDDGTVRLQITDCKILKNAKGKSRKVAFVGFRQPDQAAHVIETYHRTYLNMSRITVEAATAKKDEATKEKGGDRKTTKDTGTRDSDKTKDKTDIDAKTKDDKKATDSKVEEFLSLMGASKSKSKFWSNDTAGNEENVETKPKSSGDDSDSDSSTDSSSSDSSSSSDGEDSDDDSDDNDNQSGKQKSNNTLSDLDFLRSKTKQVDDLEVLENDDDSDSSSQSSSSSSSSGSDSEDDNEDVKMEDDKSSQNQNSSQQSTDDNPDKEYESDEDDDEKQLAEATGASKTRLFVRNLAFETTEEDLEEHFSPFGPLTECHIPVDDQKRNKGFAFVTFQSAIDAMEATNQLDKVDFQGRLLHILQARPPPPQASRSDHDRNLTWKQKQELARKEKETKGATGQAAQGWSASFVRGDAVVDNLAERLGLRKDEILGVKDDLSSGEAAVRLALGETQIIEENREYFRQHGVDMEALVSANTGTTGQSAGSGGSTKRSKTSILVKNLPFDTRVEELEKLFHVGQEPVKILLPPSRTIAMIEYGHSTDAKRAFRKLAYRRFKHVPIYLEWAPLAAKQANPASSASAPASQQPAPRDDEKSDTADDAETTTDGVSSTLYVKNLNFETTEDTLREVFGKHSGGKVLSVRIPRKVAPTRHGEEEARSLSMGYGFVELASHEAAQRCTRTMQGRLVDGYALQLALSSQKPRKTAAVPLGKKTPTKIMVRNVPFQATRKEILMLFGSFGQLKKVRLPKKFDGSHRGFAFVEFLTGKEALAAMTALARTHLYGRHLVLEWASTADDQNVEHLRDRAKRDAAGAAAASAESKRKNKKIRFD